MRDPAQGQRRRNSTATGQGKRQRDRTAGRALAWHGAHPGSIPGTPSSPLNPAGIRSEWGGPVGKKPPVRKNRLLLTCQQGGFPRHTPTHPALSEKAAQPGMGWGQGRGEGGGFLPGLSSGTGQLPEFRMDSAGHPRRGCLGEDVRGVTVVPLLALSSCSECPSLLLLLSAAAPRPNSAASLMPQEAPPGAGCRARACPRQSCPGEGKRLW